VATFENSVMRRPIEEVFGFLSDFENAPKWNYVVVDTTRPPRPTRASRPRGATAATGQ
jgi:hypothetical protein